MRSLPPLTPSSQGAAGCPFADLACSSPAVASAKRGLTAAPLALRQVTADTSASGTRHCLWSKAGMVDRMKAWGPGVACPECPATKGAPHVRRRLEREAHMHMQVVWGRILPGRWSAFEAAY